MHGHDGTTVICQQSSEKPRHQKLHLETLSDFLHEHVSISGESIHGQDCSVRSAISPQSDQDNSGDDQSGNLQSKDLGGISRLDTISLALPGVSCNDAEVRTSNGQYRASVL